MKNHSSPYKKNYFCRRCSGVGNRGKRHWVPRDKVSTDPPRCPDCGGLLRDRPIIKEVDGEMEVYQLRLGTR